MGRGKDGRFTRAGRRRARKAGKGRKWGEWFATGFFTYARHSKDGYIQIMDMATSKVYTRRRAKKRKPITAEKIIQAVIGTVVVAYAVKYIATYAYIQGIYQSALGIRRLSRW